MLIFGIFAFGWTILVYPGDKFDFGLLDDLAFVFRDSFIYCCDFVFVARQVPWLWGEVAIMTLAGPNLPELLLSGQ